MTRPAALLHRIHRRYRTITAPLAIEAVHLQFTRIEDPDRVLDEVAMRDDVRHLPYWAELWDSALGVGQYLAKHYPLEKTGQPLHVLDLGCGMGLAGTMAAALGHQVLFADLESSALLFARLNSLSFESRVRTRRLDWGQDQLRERFDLIVGSDILYERAQWPMLEQFWSNHLARGGVVILGEPGRQTGELFPAWLSEHPWRLTEDQASVPTRDKPIRIFHLENSG